MGLCRLSRAVCESMGGRWRDGAGSLPTLGIRSHRCLHTSGRGRAVGQILDHRETAVGLCRLSRAVCESMGGRWRDGAGSLPTLGIRSHRYACTQEDAGGLRGRFWTIEKRRWDCAGCRAQSARVWEGDGATAQAVCRPWVSGSHRCLHTCWRGRSMGQIFDHRETVMGAALAGAHSLRESRGAMARRRGQFADLGYPGHTDACTLVVAGGLWDRFSTIEKR
jgi:hypothetical protein